MSFRGIGWGLGLLLAVNLLPSGARAQQVADADDVQQLSIEQLANVEITRSPRRPSRFLPPLPPFMSSAMTM